MRLSLTRQLLSVVLFGLAMVAARQATAIEANYQLYEAIKGEHAIVGPLVGHVTDTTAKIWAYAGPRSAPLVLEIAELGVSSADSAGKPYQARLEQQPNPAKHHEVEFNVTGLRPLTTYAFAVRLSDDDSGVQPGTFTTAPAAGEDAKFSVAVSSCFGNTYRREDGRTSAKREYVTKSWPLLLDRNPDLQLIIGDNVYADSTDYNHLWDSHVLERVANRPFAQSIRTIPTYAVWDDHDYGPNNSDGTARGKEQSLRAFDEVFANPPRRGGGGPGIYTSFSWGGVDFFLLDGRYHRSPNEERDGEGKKFLGDEQFDWLIQELKASKAPFKLLVCGSTWMSSRTDGWRIFRTERQRLWQAIVDHKIEGVVFVSGDIHRNELPLHPPDAEGGYWMPEITSSGLGAHGEHAELGFVIVEFDTTGDDPHFVARSINGKNREVLTRQVWASDLKIRQD